MMKRYHSLSPILSILCLTLLGLAVWWMSAHVVWLGDDLDYKYMMKGEIWQSWGFINTLQDFLDSQLMHYQHVNGRFIAHSLVQLFNGILGQGWFAVCNAIVYVVFALLISVAGGVDPFRNAAGLLSATCLSVLCFITKMMPTCQIGYIWGMVVNLIWLMAFYSKGQPPWRKVCVMSLAGIIIGNWQESLSIGVCAGLGIWWLLQLFHKPTLTLKSFEWRRSWMILGYFIGTAINCLSPSTLGRVGSITISSTDRWLITAYSLPAIIMLALALLWLMCRKNHHSDFLFNKKEWKIPDYFFIPGVILLLIFNAAIGIYSNRQLFGANLFAAILLLRRLPRHSAGVLFNTIATVAVLLTWWVMYDGIRDIRRQYADIVRLHDISPDGSVEYDRTRQMPFGYPLGAKYYEDILGQFDNDLHHSMMKDFKHSRRGKTLKLKPTAIPDSEKCEEYAPGHFYLTLQQPGKNEPKREVTVFGHHSIGGIIEFPASPRKLVITRYSRMRPPFSTAVIIPEYPFFKTDSIVF